MSADGSGWVGTAVNLAIFVYLGWLVWLYGRPAPPAAEEDPPPGDEPGSDRPRSGVDGYGNGG